MRHPERFDPRDGTGRLIDSEHRARYHWAASTVAGKAVLDAGCGVGYGMEILAAAGAESVTGIDIDPEAVEASNDRCGELAQAIAADLRNLPLQDDGFEVATCFETIEHLEGHEQALAELRRVLQPNGVLIISSPNPDVYLSGNEHHVREFRPEELVEAVRANFANVTAYRQDAWVGSTIEHSATASSVPGETLRTAAPEAGDPTYGIVVASDGELPQMSSILAFGDAFDVRWWSTQLTNKNNEIEATQERLGETSAALHDAQQKLIRIPLLENKVSELGQLHADLSSSYHDVINSWSWRITAPLRRRRFRGNR